MERTEGQFRIAVYRSGDRWSLRIEDPTSVVVVRNRLYATPKSAMLDAQEYLGIEGAEVDLNID